MHRNIILFITCFLALYCSAQKSDTLSNYNGTYNSPTNLFKNNNYIRVHFFNDSIFLFTMIQAYNQVENGIINAENKNLRFNGHSFFGIARLVNYKGVKTWIGISDFFATYIEPGDPSYFSLKGRVDFDAILKILENHNPYAYRENGFNYNVYQFFLKKDKISMIGIKGVTRFFEIGEYHKVDDFKMLFGIADNDDFFEISHNANYHDNESEGITKVSCKLIPVPLSEKIPENIIVASLHKGDEVYMTGHDFMKYAFVVQFSKNYKVTKYGWVARNLLEKAK
jgi:hypothetical protein